MFVLYLHCLCGDKLHHLSPVPNPNSNLTLNPIVNSTSPNPEPQFFTTFAQTTSFAIGNNRTANYVKF